MKIVEILFLKNVVCDVMNDMCNNHYIKCLFTSYGDKKPKETLTSLKWISKCSLTLKLFETEHLFLMK